MTDFDGTLAPIVDDPGRSLPVPGVPALLDRLAQRFAVVAVVSGRPVEFLAERLLGPGGRSRSGRPPKVSLFGLYGIERITPGGESVLPAAQQWRSAVAAVVDEARESAPGGVGVEDKGLTVTLHWRRAPEHARWAVSFARARARSTGLELSEGRMSSELKPPRVGDKGAVVREVGAGLHAACFLGDDRGDLPAFEALDGLTAEGLVAVKIAVASEEAPPALLRQADLVVDGPQGAKEVLEALA